MNNSLTISIDFIKQLKQQIVLSRYIVAKIANAESLQLYFIIGKALDEQFKKQNWGAKVLDTVSKQLQQELPGLRGFSASNMRKMRVFYTYWGQSEAILPLITDKLKNREITFLPSATGKSNNFFSISFTHHYEILIQIKDNKDAWYYIDRIAEEFWTVKQLRIELKNKSHLQAKKLPNNFNKTLTSVLSNKAMRAFKDQYLLDFIKQQIVSELKEFDIIDPVNDPVSDPVRNLVNG